MRMPGASRSPAQGNRKTNGFDGLDADRDEDMLVEPQMRSDRAYLDLGCGITQMLSDDRVFKRQNDWRDRDYLEPNETYKRFVSMSVVL